MLGASYKIDSRPTSSGICSDFNRNGEREESGGYVANFFILFGLYNCCSHWHTSCMLLWPHVWLVWIGLWKYPPWVSLIFNVTKFLIHRPRYRWTQRFVDFQLYHLSSMPSCFFLTNFLFTPTTFIHTLLLLCWCWRALRELATPGMMTTFLCTHIGYNHKLHGLFSVPEMLYADCCGPYTLREEFNRHIKLTFWFYTCIYVDGKDQL